MSCQLYMLIIGIQESGIDVRLGEIGGYIQETMESYEVEVDGRVYPGQSFYSCLQPC